MLTNASPATVFERFAAQAIRTPQAEALVCGTANYTYHGLLESVQRVAQRLRQLGVQRGMRVAVLAENRPEYTMLQLAAAKLGAMVACLNWRLSPDELQHSVSVVSPQVLTYSTRFASAVTSLNRAAPHVLDLEALCRAPGDLDQGPVDAKSTDGLLIIFTSGTTGRPRAAVISQRAEIARMELLQRDLGLNASDAYVAWSPMFHMGGSEHTLSSLMYGATVVICDGLDVRAITAAMSQRKLGWLLLVPATIEPILAELERTGAPIAGIKTIGCMADLVPTATIDSLCRRVAAPFLNSFGSTETGLPPLSGHLLPVGDPLTDLSKRMNSGCELRLVDAAGHDVLGDAVGEAWVRGPTLFSGYWTDNALDTRCFRGEWYPMGDLFRRTASGGFQFVGRSKYLIKSGAENIYPAEIERVLLEDSRVEDAAVVRRPDSKWGEVPVAFVVRRDPGLEARDIEALCRARLAGYKQPKAIYFLAADEMPRNATGKIIREQLEQLGIARNADPPS